MVKRGIFDKNGIKRGAWSEEEDNRLRACIMRFDHSNWRLLPFVAGLKRCGKSCRLRWVNYLKPGLRRGNFTKDEEKLIIKLHKQLGNKWSAMATYFPGRTDNDIKNYWHAHILKPRNRAMMRIQNLPKEGQSLSNDSCTTTGVNQEKPASSEVVLEQGLERNIGVLESNADSHYNAAAAAAGDHLYQSSDYCNFVEEECYGGGLEQDDFMSKLFDSSDFGVDYWNMSDAKSEAAGFFTEPIEEEFLNMGSWLW